MRMENEKHRFARLVVALALVAAGAVYRLRPEEPPRRSTSLSPSPWTMPACPRVSTSSRLTSERVVTLQLVGGHEAKTTMTNNGSSTKSDGRAKLVFHKTATRTSWLPRGCRIPITLAHYCRPPLS